jgi:hypothetical protein
LLDRVFPRVPVRHWVATYSRQVRWHLAEDPKLARAALDVFMRTLRAYHRKRARADGVRDAEPGAVTFVPYFQGDLGRHLHFHSLVPDGVFGADGAFHELPVPEEEEVAALLARIVRRTVALLRRKGRLYDDDGPSPDDPLAALHAASSVPRPSQEP